MYGIEGLSLDVLGKDELRLVYLALRIRYEKDKERLDEAWRSDPGYTVRKRNVSDQWSLLEKIHEALLEYGDHRAKHREV